MPASRSLASRFVLVNGRYTRLWAGQSVSALGDSIFNTTLILWVATDLGRGKAWAPEAVSAVLLSASVSVLVIGPLTGVLIDRWDGRRTMLRSDQVRCAIAAGLTAVTFLPAGALSTGAWLAVICGAVVLLNAFGEFFIPARMTVIRDIVPGAADRARAAGISQATSGTIAIIGPPLAAPLLFGIGMRWALAFNAVSYAVSFIAIASVAIPPRPRREPGSGKRPSVVRDFTAGLRVFAGSRFLIALLSIAVIGQIGVATLNALNVFFVTRNLHASPQLYGFVGTSIGVGSILGALCSGRVVARIGARATVWGGLLAAGVLIIAYSRQTVFVAGVVCVVLFIIPITMLNTAMAPLMMAATPREYMGRVLAVFYPVTQLASMLSMVVASWLVGSGLRGLHASLGPLRFGPIDTIYAGAGLLVVLAGIRARRALPHLDDLAPDDHAAPDAEPQEAHSA